MAGSRRIPLCEYLSRSCILDLSIDICGSDEHYRRSPGCAFFHFAGTTAPKPGRGKKGRVSKASRLSTQSDTRIASQSQSIPELNESIDTSNLSHDTVLSEASTMASKKGGRGKGRTTRAKNAEPAKVVESTKEPSEEETQERAHDVRRGVKRKSEDISEDHRAARESTVVPECQPKRRATRSRNSEAPQLDYPVLGTVESASLQVAPGTRKRAPSRSRKISTASVNSTASQRGAIPDDMEIEAALEADLDKPMPDLPHVESESVEEPSKPKTRGRARKTNPSAAPSRNARQATADSETSQYQADLLGELRIGSREEVEEKAAAKAQGRKTRTTKKTTNKKTAPTARDSSESIATFATNADSQLNSSLLTVRSMVDDSGHETDASVASQKSVTRKGSKRKAGGKGKGKKGQAMSKNIEDILQAQPGSQAMPDFASVTDLVSIAEQDLAQLDRADDMAEAEAPKRPTRATKGKSKAATAKKAKTKFPQLSMPGMFSPLTGDDPSFNSILAPSSPPVVAVMKSGLGADQRIPVSLRVPSSPTVSETPVNNTPSHPVMISSPAQAQTATPPRNQRTNQTTPSPSPQSSDAENQPPSSRPPSARPPLAPLSPTKGNGAIQRIPIPAPGTPPRLVPLSPSKIGGGLQSALPWTAVDVEMIFVSSPEKENQNIALLTGGGGVQPGDLTSPEKAMTVEEWIRFRAGGAEERLKDEAERVVGAFEREGGRALRVLEGLEVWE